MQKRTIQPAQNLFNHFIIILLFLSLYLSALNNTYSQSKEEIEKILNNVQVTNISRSGDELWIATNGSGVYRYSYSSEKFTNYSSQNQKLQNDFIYSIDANEDYVWAGSIDGLFIFDKRKNSWSKRKFGAGGQLGNWIRAITYDPFENAVWIGRFQYLTKYDIAARSFTDYDLTRNNKEKTNNIKVIALDGDSLVWFGTEAGIHKYNKKKKIEDPGAITFYDNRLNYFQGEGDEVSISSAVFEQDNIWIGCDEFITNENPDYNLGGIFKFDKKNEWRKFSIADRLPAEGIFTMEVTGKYIWASVYEFNKNKKEAFGRGLVLIDRMNENVIALNSSSLPLTILDLFFDGNNLWVGSSDGLYKVNLRSELLPLF